MVRPRRVQLVCSVMNGWPLASPAPATASSTLPLFLVRADGARNTPSSMTPSGTSRLPLIKYRPRGTNTAPLPVSAAAFMAAVNAAVLSFVPSPTAPKSCTCRAMGAGPGRGGSGSAADAGSAPTTVSVAAVKPRHESIRRREILFDCMRLLTGVGSLVFTGVPFCDYPNLNPDVCSSASGDMVGLILIEATWRLAMRARHLAGLATLPHRKARSGAIGRNRQVHPRPPRFARLLYPIRHGIWLSTPQHGS